MEFISVWSIADAIVLGALCLLVGLFVTIPPVMIAVFFVYRKLAVTDVKETY